MDNPSYILVVLTLLILMNVTNGVLLGTGKSFEARFLFYKFGT